MMISTILSWSTGKDAAWALHRLRSSATHRVTALVTTYQEMDHVIGIHGVPLDHAREHARRLGLRLIEVPLPLPCPNELYRRRFLDALAPHVAAGASAIAFGDLFLADIREFRESLLEGSGLAPVFPLWGADTHALAREMIDGGLIASVVAVTPPLGSQLRGRRFDHELLRELPAGVDPCGERGEFHTLVTDGPMFRP